MDKTTTALDPAKLIAELTKRRAQIVPQMGVNFMAPVFDGVFQILIDAIRDSSTEVTAALEQVAEPVAWRTMETAPKDGTMCLLFEPHDMGGFAFVGCMDRYGEWINNLDIQTQHPTHWQPLPAAPLKQKDRK